MKWAIGTVVLVLVLLTTGVLMVNNVTTPLGTNETKFAKDIYGESEVTDKPAPLVEIYNGISVSKNIKELDLSGRGLDGSLKAEVRLLTELKVLDLSGNEFTGLPAEVGQLSKLEVLDLSDNQFTGLPHELANLDNLDELNLANNDISEFDLSVIVEGLSSDTNIVTEASLPVNDGEEPETEELVDEGAGADTGDEAVACTMDAKMCPDGSFVGRTGPNCEFAPCPTE